MKSFQDFTFPTRIQDGIPRGNPRDEKEKCLTGRNILASFYLILWNPFKTSLFLQLSRIGSQGTTRGTKKENAWQVENPSIFYWILWCRFRTSLFPPGSRMGYPGITKGAKKGTCLTHRKTLAGFYWIGWSPFKTSLSPPLSRMGSRGTTRGTKKKNARQAEKP